MSVRYPNEAKMTINLKVSEIPDGISPVAFEKIMLNWVYRDLKTFLETAPFDVERRGTGFEDPREYCPQISVYQLLL